MCGTKCGCVLSVFWKHRCLWEDMGPKLPWVAAARIRTRRLAVAALGWLRGQLEYERLSETVLPMASQTELEGHMQGG
jgi:hypothetical protein